MARFFYEKSEGVNHLLDLNVNGRIILKSKLKI